MRDKNDFLKFCYVYGLQKVEWKDCAFHRVKEKCQHE